MKTFKTYDDNGNLKEEIKTSGYLALYLDDKGDINITGAIPPGNITLDLIEKLKHLGPMLKKFAMSKFLGFGG
jgi:hypothetical protein